MRDAVRPVIDDWISRRLEEAINNIELPPNVADIRDLRRKGIELTLNGLTPTPYTRQLSPYNVWVMRLLMSCPGVRYRKGKITSVERLSDRRLEIGFDDGGRGRYDRVMTRYGTRGHVPVATSARRDAIAGDYLLAAPEFIARDPKNPTQGSVWRPARDGLLRSMDALLPIARSTRVDIPKQHYVRHLTDGPNAVPPEAGLSPDPQRMLSAELKSRRRPTYQADAITERFMR